MKTGTHPSLLVLGSVWATISTLGQPITYTWTGQGDGTSLAISNNWNPVGLPSGATNDTAQWAGVTTSNLLITYGSVSLPVANALSSGINVVLTPNQTNPVQIVSSVPNSANLALNRLTNDSEAAAFELGDDSANQLQLSMRPDGIEHDFVNNSASPITVHSSVAWQAGGGIPYILALGGTGDWNINNHLQNNNSVASSIVKLGSGTLTWTPAGSPGNSVISTVTVHSGKLLINGNALAADTIVDGGTLGGTGSLSGPVTLNAPATLAPGTSIGTLIFSNNLTIGGNLAIEVNKSWSPSNDFVVVSGTLNQTGVGTLTVTNLGPALKAGDKFTLFNKPLQNGAFVTVTSEDGIWANNLAGDGSITLTTLRKVYTWTGANDGTNLNLAANWTTNDVDPASTLPNGFNELLADGFQEIARWDGRTPTNLVLSYTTPGWPGNFAGSWGVNLAMTARQTNDVQLISPNASSATITIRDITLNSPGAAFTLGDDTTNRLTVIARPSGADHQFVNNSTSPATIHSSVRWQGGDGGAYTLWFRGSGDWIVNNYLRTINGVPCSIVKEDAGAMIWTPAGFLGSTAITATTVNNGRLIANGDVLAGNVIVNAGTLGGGGSLSGAVTTSPGSTVSPGTSIGTLTISNNLSLGGNLVIQVDKSLSPSNDLVFVTGTLNNAGAGTVTVANLGPSLQVGDKFTLFNKALQNGGAMTVTGASAVWTNNLATDGSITLLSFLTPKLNFSQPGPGGNLEFNWIGSFKLQAQTNTAESGFNTNSAAWADYPQGGNSPVSVPRDAAAGTVFFRLVSSP